MRFDLISGDTHEPIKLAFPTGVTAAQFAGATANFTMEQEGGTATVTGAAQITDAFYYTPTPGDTATPGVYRSQFHVTYSDGSEESFPTDEPLWVVVHPQS